MWRALMYQLALIPLVQAQNDYCRTHRTFREPANTDINVYCGTNRMELHILLCPVYFGGYNETLMSLNAQYFKGECRGTPDWTVDPPILKYNFSITEEAVSACNNKIKITQEVGSGLFADFSSVQFVNISGMINSLDPSAGTITYRQEMIYKFSCRYPLQYLVNNTEMTVSGVSLAVKDSNGSFISTLSMMLYSDRFYTTQLKVPEVGLTLKTRIFVEVKATNLTGRFNVLLDRCYATTSPYPVNSTYYDLFVGCNRDGQTVMGVNGQQQEARFSFEAFRFVQHKNRTLSTFYLHCSTRLCERSVCTSLQQNCTDISSRRKREVQDTSVTDTATVSSGPIRTQVDNGDTVGIVSEVSEQLGGKHRSLQGVAIAAGIVGALCISMVAFIAYWIIVPRTIGATEKRMLFTTKE
ncbi:zona pellucida-like domain-containing protein 1 [Oncorhynchus nerka]|uniref:ZP domain-containing protein n=1 Tax=Oncorhynchus tshawytscha TaxID=74940 RepID=A0A8C8J685_ONCTS|nr:zona pellucida-like domain-containing protein 1 [Oncorhynchus tshawytscha]XP_029527224.1 zona pellucida-like domain-containing protein 1 [Oncorhynchus nerka]